MDYETHDRLWRHFTTFAGIVMGVLLVTGLTLFVMWLFLLMGVHQ